MTYETGTIGQFMAWTKQVIRDPKATRDPKVAKENPKRWFDTEKNARSVLGREVSPEAMVKLLSPQNLRLLWVLAKKQPQSVQELADLTGRAQASVSRTLKRLVEAGIVAMARGKDRKLRPELIATRVQLEIDLTGAKGKAIAVRPKAAA